MRCTLHTRPLAVLIPLALAALAPPVLAMQRTQEANLLPVVKLSAPGDDYEDAPSQIRSDLILGVDGNFYMGSFSGGGGPGAIARLTPAGELTTLYSLADDGSEGNTIFGRLMQTPDGNLYGTTFFGTDAGLGSLFRLTPDGTFTILHKFGGGEPNPATPYTGVTLGPDGLIYGTTMRGGADDRGTIFRIATDGTGFTVLHEFDGSDGENPQGALIVAEGMLYGTTAIGGARNRGTIYRISTAGAFELLYSFPAFSSVQDEQGVNDVGANPRASLLYSALDQNFYGTAYFGGAHGHGTLFRFDPDSGTAEAVHAFGGPSFSASRPMSSVVQDAAGNFYGTSEVGGYLNGGAAWRVAPDGSFSLLHGFTGASIDGHTPMAGLLLANGTLYGVSSSDTVGGDGTIFTLDLGSGGALPVELRVSASELTDEEPFGEVVTLEWSAPAGSTCTKLSSSAAGWTGDVAVAGTQQLTLLPAVYILGLSCTDADDGNEATPPVVRTAHVGIVVNAPLLNPVDGGGGAGSLSLLWLLFAAALLVRKLTRESRLTCP